MVETKKQFSHEKDYREKFEFRLTVGDNIICQRYFKINNFNPRSLNSLELAHTLQNCVSVIDEDLKSKTAVYLSVFAPKYFNNLEEMAEYFKDGKNSNELNLGTGIVVKGMPHDYVWGKNNAPVACDFKFDDGELNRELTDDDRVDYKFAFCVDGKETCSVVWEGVYPKYIRNSIDLSNRKGKHEGEDLSKLNFEQYLDYCIVKGRNDLVWGLIKDICHTCSVQDNSWYTTHIMGYNNVPDYSIWVDKYGNKVGK